MWLAAAVAGGLLIGIERGWTLRKERAGTRVANMAVKIGVTLAYARRKGTSAALALAASTLVLAASIAVAWIRM